MFAQANLPLVRRGFALRSEIPEQCCPKRRLIVSRPSRAAWSRKSLLVQQRSGVCTLSARSSVQFDPTEDYYAVLGVESDADLATIKRAYRRLALQNHPDANRDPQAREKFIRILRAYEVLSNEDARKQYDLQRRSPGSGPFWGIGGPGAQRRRSSSTEEYPEDLNDSFGAIFSDLMEQLGRLWQEGTKENGIFADFVEFLESQGANWGSLRNEDLNSVLTSSDEDVLQAELDDARFVREQCEQRLRLLQNSLELTERRRAEQEQRAKDAHLSAGTQEEARSKVHELSLEARRLQSRIRQVQSLIARQRSREGLLQSRLDAIRRVQEARAASEEKVRNLRSEVEEELEKLKRDLGKL